MLEGKILLSILQGDWGKPASYGRPCRTGHRPRSGASGVKALAIKADSRDPLAVRAAVGGVAGTMQPTDADVVSGLSRLLASEQIDQCAPVFFEQRSNVAVRPSARALIDPVFHKEFVKLGHAFFSDTGLQPRIE